MFITTEADDGKVLFENEGKYPFRPTFDALIKYRKEKFNSIGVVPGNGCEWYKFREGFKPLLKLSIYQSYRQEHKKIAKSFLKYLVNQRDENDIIHDLLTHSMKFAIESKYIFI